MPSINSQGRTNLVPNSERILPANVFATPSIGGNGCFRQGITRHIAYAKDCTFCLRTIKSLIEDLFFFRVVEEGKSNRASSNGVHKFQSFEMREINQPAET